MLLIIWQHKCVAGNSANPLRDFLMADLIGGRMKSVGHAYKNITLVVTLLVNDDRRLCCCYWCSFVF